MSTEREQLLKLESLSKEKKYDEFLPLAQKAAQQYPTSFQIHLLYGQVLLALSRYKDAEEILLELLKSYPDNINLLLELGKLFQLQQNKDQALEYFNRILFLDPFNSQAKQAIELMDGTSSDSDDIDISREQTEVELIIPEELTQPPPEEEVKPATPVPDDIPEQSFEEVLSEENEADEVPHPSPPELEEPVTQPEPIAEPSVPPSQTEANPLDDLEILPPDQPQPEPVAEPPGPPTPPKSEPTIPKQPPASPLDDLDIQEPELVTEPEAESVEEEPERIKEQTDPLAPISAPAPPRQKEKQQPPTLDRDKPPMDDTTPLDVVPLQEEQLTKEVDGVEDKVRQIAESEIRQTLPDAETVTARAAEEEAKPEAEAEFVTESAAEIYLQQGHVGEALKIYEQLYQTQKEDHILEKIKKLKVRYISQKKIDALTKFLDLIQQRS